MKYKSHGMLKLPITLRKLHSLGLTGNYHPSFDKVDVYANSENAILEIRLSILGKFFVLLVFPFSLIRYGFKDTIEAIKALVFQDKDCFSSYNINLNESSKMTDYILSIYKTEQLNNERSTYSN